MTKNPPVAPPRIANRFAELVRVMVENESEAALAVLFNHSVTAINNWYKGRKLPREKDIEEFAEQCGVTADELRTADDGVWKAVLERASAESHVVVTPAWLQLDDRVSGIEKSIPAAGVIILTADAFNDTQRRLGQDVVRQNIMRGVNYFYVVPEGCENERSLTRFVESLKTLNSPQQLGTAKIIKTVRTRKTIRQWKRIDHVKLFAYGENLSRIDNLPDLAQLRIDDGYEQLYKAGDQPYDGDLAWKTLSVREIDYYKELLEEWGAIGDDDGDVQHIMPGLRLLGSPADGRRWLKNNTDGVEHVYNTVYRSEDGTNASPISYFEETVAIMASCLEQGCQWVDLGFFGHENFVRQVHESLLPRHRAAYSAAVLPADVPVIQTRCLHYKNNRSAVLMGWGFPGSDAPQVFFSDEAGIASYFRSYFNSLLTRAKKIY